MPRVVQHDRSGSTEVDQVGGERLNISRKGVGNGVTVVGDSGHQLSGFVLIEKRNVLMKDGAEETDSDLTGGAPFGVLHARVLHG